MQWNPSRKCRPLLSLPELPAALSSSKTLKALRELGLADKICMQSPFFLACFVPERGKRYKSSKMHARLHMLSSDSVCLTAPPISSSVSMSMEIFESEPLLPVFL